MITTYSLWYSNMLCGLIQGSLEIINYKVKANFVKDTLRGDDSTDIRVKLIEKMQDKMNEEYLN